MFAMFFHQPLPPAVVVVLLAAVVVLLAEIVVLLAEVVVRFTPLPCALTSLLLLFFSLFLFYPFNDVVSCKDFTIVPRFHPSFVLLPL